MLLFGISIFIFFIISIAGWLLTNPHIFSQKPPYQAEEKKVPGQLSGWMFVAIALSCGLGTWAILYWLQDRNGDE